MPVVLRCLLGCARAVVLLAWIIGLGTAGAAVNLSFSPTPATVKQGETITTDIDVDIDDLYAFQLTIAFDPNVVAAVSVTEGEFLSSGGTKPTVFISGNKDNSNGVITLIAGTLLGPIGGSSGTGVLLRITWKGISAGRTPLTITQQDLVLLDSHLVDILPHTRTDGEIVVPGTRPPVVDGQTFEMGRAANLNIGDSVINITNTGTSSSDICANVYTFGTNEELISCCSCLVTPNGLKSLSVKSDLISNTLTPSVPTSIVIKFVGTTGGGCNPSSPTSTNLAPGLLAWGTTLHALPTTPITYGLTENEFLSAPISDAELTKLTSFCGFIQANGSGYGICKSCRAGGLGAVKN